MNLQQKQSKNFPFEGQAEEKRNLCRLLAGLGSVKISLA